MTEVMQQNQAATDQQPHGFFAQTAPLSGSVSALFASAQAAGSRIIYDDGTFECLQPSQTPGDPPKHFPASELRGTPGSAPKKVSFGLVNFMWFEPTLLYHSSVKLPSGKEGLLVDCGAVGNLVGESWCKRFSAIANPHGHGSKETPLSKAHSLLEVLEKTARKPTCR